tara:strand:+ start:1949 stop:2053 length:105 start_codon:yes stop_codon:yes gene_type:complete
MIQALKILILSVIGCAIAGAFFQIFFVFVLREIV